MGDPLASAISQRLTKSLPGKEAHALMTSSPARLHASIPDHHQKAAVNICLYQENSHWHTVFIKRPSTDRLDRHSGQISLPGGRTEISDPHLGVTALRETQEEIGIHQNQMKLLGSLSPLYIPVSNYLVHPYISLAEGSIDMEAQESEVESIIPAQLRKLTIDRNILRTTIRINDQLSIKDVPYFDLDGHVIWGATAMIMSEFVGLFHDSEWHALLKNS